MLAIGCATVRRCTPGDLDTLGFQRTADRINGTVFLAFDDLLFSLHEQYHSYLD